MTEEEAHQKVLEQSKWPDVVKQHIDEGWPNNCATKNSLGFTCSACYWHMVHVKKLMRPWCQCSIPGS